MSEKSNAMYFQDKIPIQFQNKEFIEAWKDFVDYRLGIDRRFSEKAAKLIFEKLKQMSHGDTNKAISLLNTSIERGWKSVFESSMYSDRSFRPQNKHIEEKQSVKTDPKRITNSYLKGEK